MCVCVCVCVCVVCVRVFACVCVYKHIKATLEFGVPFFDNGNVLHLVLVCQFFRSEKTKLNFYFHTSL